MGTTFMPLPRIGAAFLRPLANAIAKNPAVAVHCPALKPSDLEFSHALGIRAAPAGSAHLLELPLAPVVANHLGTMHAAAQFALAESASAACLQRDFPQLDGRVFAVVRGARLKYRRPAGGTLFAFAAPDEFTRTHLVPDLATRSRAAATVRVELKDAAGHLTFAGDFEWFIAHSAPATP